MFGAAELTISGWSPSREQIVQFCLVRIGLLGVIAIQRALLQQMTQGQVRIFFTPGEYPMLTVEPIELVTGPMAIRLRRELALACATGAISHWLLHTPAPEQTREMLGNISVALNLLTIYIESCCPEFHAALKQLETTRENDEER